MKKFFLIVFILSIKLKGNYYIALRKGEEIHCAKLLIIE